MKVHDELTRGIVSGIIAGLPISAVGLALYYGAQMYRTRFMDFTAVLIMGHRPHSIDEAVFAWLATFIWVGACGASQAYLLKLTTARNHILKGTVFGGFLWFLFYSGATTLRLQTLIAPVFSNALTNLLLSLSWGALTVAIIRGLEPVPAHRADHVRNGGDTRRR